MLSFWQSNQPKHLYLIAASVILINRWPGETHPCVERDTDRVAHACPHPQIVARARHKVFMLKNAERPL